MTYPSDLSALAHALLGIKGSLTSSWNALGRLHSNNAPVFEYPNNPEASKAVAEEVHHLSGGLSVVFLMALLEAHIDPNEPRNNPTWHAFLDRLDPENHKKLKAYKHVRHSVAHGIEGARALKNQDHAKCFDEVMARKQPSDRIQGVRVHNDKRIELANGVGVECFLFLRSIVDGALQAELASCDA